MKLQDEEGQVKPFTEYEQKYVIIDSKESLKGFVKKKIKKSWFNDKGKLCLTSFIYLGDDKSTGSIITIPVIEGKAQDDVREKLNVDEILTKGLLFVGYLGNDIIEQQLRLKEQGSNFN